MAYVLNTLLMTRNSIAYAYFSFCILFSRKKRKKLNIVPSKLRDVALRNSSYTISLSVSDPDPVWTPGSRIQDNKYQMELTLFILKELYTSISTLAQKLVFTFLNNKFILKILNSTPFGRKIRKHFRPKNPKSQFSA